MPPRRPRPVLAANMSGMGLRFRPSGILSNCALNPPATRKLRSEGAEFDSMPSCASLRRKWVGRGRGAGAGGSGSVVFDSAASRCRGNVPSASFGRGALLRRFAKSLLPHRLSMLQSLERPRARRSLGAASRHVVAEIPRQSDPYS